MSKLFSIAKYEYKMQIKRPAGWLVLLFVFLSAMADSLPTASNMARLEFLNDISYYIRRILSFDGLLLLFGLLFLMSNRLVDDRKTGRRELFISSPVRKGNYLLGKLLGNFLYALTMMYTLLAGALIGFLLFSKSVTPAGAYLVTVFKASLYLIFPASFLVVAISVMLPEIIEIRLFYMLSSVFFFVNAFFIDSSEKMPFYIFLQGDLSKLVWHHPSFPMAQAGSIALNLLFMIGTGTAAIILVAAKQTFWGAE